MAVREKIRKNFCILFQTFQELQDWKKEIFAINKNKLQQQQPPLPNKNKHKLFKYKTPTLLRSKRLQARVPAELDPNIRNAELIPIPSIHEIQNPKLRELTLVFC